MICCVYNLRQWIFIDTLDDRLLTIFADELQLNRRLDFFPLIFFTQQLGHNFLLLLGKIRLKNVRTSSGFIEEHFVFYLELFELGEKHVLHLLHLGGELFLHIFDLIELSL